MSYLAMLTEKFPIRKSAAQKEAFRAWAVEEMTRLGYQAKVEKNGKSDNIVAGDPEKAQAVFTAHYDTPASIGLPNIMIPRNMPLYFAVQLLMVGVLLVVAFAAALLFELLVPGTTAAPVVGWLVYMCLLMLMLMGPANRHNVNDNTSGVSAIMETMALIAPEDRDKVAFILFDNEERGLVGSKAYAKEHLEVQHTRLIVNLDCVGLGENLLMITPKLAALQPIYPLLEKALSDRAAKDEKRKILFFPKKGSSCNSDQKSFRCGVAVMACKKAPVVGYYCDRIHTLWDTEADEGNLTLLADGLSAFAAAIPNNSSQEEEEVGNF